MVHDGKQSATASRVPAWLHANYGAVGAVIRGATLDGLAANRRNATVEKAIENGLMFAGTPDQVMTKFGRFYRHVGGFGHLLIMETGGAFWNTTKPSREFGASHAMSIRG